MRLLCPDEYASDIHALRRGLGCVWDNCINERERNDDFVWVSLFPRRDLEIELKMMVYDLSVSTIYVKTMLDLPVDDPRSSSSYTVQTIFPSPRSTHYDLRDYSYPSLYVNMPIPQKLTKESITRDIDAGNIELLDKDSATYFLPYLSMLVVSDATRFTAIEEAVVQLLRRREAGKTPAENLYFDLKTASGQFTSFVQLSQQWDQITHALPDDTGKAIMKRLAVPSGETASTWPITCLPQERFRTTVDARLACTTITTTTTRTITTTTTGSFRASWLQTGYSLTIRELGGSPPGTGASGGAELPIPAAVRIGDGVVDFYKADSLDSDGIWVPYTPQETFWAWSTQRTRWIGSGAFSGCIFGIFKDKTDTQRIGAVHVAMPSHRNNIPYPHWLKWQELASEVDMIHSNQVLAPDDAAKLQPKWPAAYVFLECCSGGTLWACTTFKVTRVDLAVAGQGGTEGEVVNRRVIQKWGHDVESCTDW